MRDNYANIYVSIYTYEQLCKLCEQLYKEHVLRSTILFLRARIFRNLLLPRTKMYFLFSSLLIFIVLLPSTFAQFQFFEQMFSGNAHHHHHQQQQQQPQNVASDSNWYRQTYDGGIVSFYFISNTCFSQISLYLRPHLQFLFFKPNTSTKNLSPYTQSLIYETHSLLLQLPMPIHARMCAFPASLPVRVPRQ